MKFKKYDWTGFSDRDRIFCYEYLVEKNKTQCAINAGFSKKSAQQQSQRVYAKCKERIIEMMEDIAEPHQVTADRIIQELAKVGFMNAQDFFDNDGRPIPIQKLDADISSNIAGMKVRTESDEEGDVSTVIEYKLCDKIDALKLLGQNLQMFTRKLIIDDKRPKVIVKDMTGRKKRLK